MFFGGYDDEDDDRQETSSQKDESENFEDVVPELDLGEPPDYLKEFAIQHIGESRDPRSISLQKFRDIIYGKNFKLNEDPSNLQIMFPVYGASRS
jgi:hypothetical protein